MEAESKNPVCCRIGCGRDAVFDLMNTDVFESDTQSCEQCVAELFFDGCNSIEKTPWLVEAA